MSSSPTSLAQRIFFFFFNDTATTEIYTLSLHDALPICRRGQGGALAAGGERGQVRGCQDDQADPGRDQRRSEEHTSELQSLAYLVCRLLLEKKKKTQESPNRRHALAQ